MSAWISYRNWEEMLAERGAAVNDTQYQGSQTLFRQGPQQRCPLYKLCADAA